MAVIALFRNPDRPLPVTDQLDALTLGLPAESAETHAFLATRQSTLILQRLEAGQ
jgi:hypothetical protein